MALHSALTVTNSTEYYRGGVGSDVSAVDSRLTDCLSCVCVWGGGVALIVAAHLQTTPGVPLRL